MKVVLDDCVYMKLNDVRDLVHSGIFPAYFLNDISKRGIGYYNNEQYLRFDNRDEINELRHLDFIIDYNEYVGRIGVGKVDNGTIKLNQDAIIVNHHEPDKYRKVKIGKLYEFEEIGRASCRERV